MSAPSFLGTAAVWGTPTGRTYGIVTSYDEEETSLLGQVEDENGAIVGVVPYDTHTKVTMACVALAASSAPSTGTKITLGDASNVVVESVRTSRTNNGTKTFTITGTKYHNLATSGGTQS